MIRPPFVAEAVRWRPGVTPEACDLSSALADLGDAAKASEGEFVWIHLEVGDPESVRPILRDEIGFHPVSLDDALSPRIRPGLENRDDYIYFAVPARDRADLEAPFYQISFFLRQDVLITLTHQVSEVIDDVQLRMAKGDGSDRPTAAEISHLVVDSVVDQFFPVLDDLNDRIEDIEESVYRGVRVEAKEAIDLKRSLLLMRKQISPIRDTLNALLRRESPLVAREVVADLQDVYDHTLRVAESIDLARDLLSTIMDAQLNIVSNRLNEVMRILTVISTLMMACSLVAGIYGMNFKHMPELDWRWGYPFAIGLMIGSCGLILWLFRRKDWI